MTAAVDNIAIKPEQSVRPMKGTQTQLEKDLAEASSQALKWMRERGHIEINIIELFASATVKEPIASARAIRVPPFRAGANRQ